MIDVIHNSDTNSTDSEDNFVQSCKPINTDLYSDTLWKWKTIYTGPIFFVWFLCKCKCVKTQDLWDYREFDQPLTPKSGNDHDQLDQVRRFIFKTGFQKPIIISCDLQDGKGYIIEENHNLWAAFKDRIPFHIQCCVIANWLPPLAPIKTLKLTNQFSKSKDWNIWDYLCSINKYVLE